MEAIYERKRARYIKIAAMGISRIVNESLRVVGELIWGTNWEKKK